MRELLGSLAVQWPFARVPPVARALSALNPHARISWSQEGEDLVMARLMEPRRIGFYVDVGAHDPYRFSNTAYFYLSGWRGIDIEPDPVGFAKLREVRSRDIVLNLGIADQPGQLTFHRFDEPALNTFDARLAIEREGTTPYRIRERIGVSVERLDAILERYVGAGQAIDFLTIDTEGLDHKVLLSNNWRRFRPEIVVVEILGLEFEKIGAHELARFMVSVGYRPVAKAANSVFFASE